MLASIGSRRATRRSLFVLLFLICTASAGEAGAKAKPKKLDAAAEQSALLLDRSTASTPARFFTINQVLARHDRNDRAEPPRLAAAGSAGALIDASTGAAATRSGVSEEPFGLSTFRAPEGLLWVKWRGVQETMRGEAQIWAGCRTARTACSSAAARHFLAIVDAARVRDGRARIEAVNRAINAAVRYASDPVQHGVPDLWSAPLATLGTGRGDCEDYAIAKYAALREAGVGADELRLLLVRDRAAGQDHAVLGVRDEGRWLVLDNRHSVLNEAAELRQLTPLFALDQQGVKLFAAPYVLRELQEHESAVAPATAAPDALPIILRGSIAL
jgi:predicted transglutaminase-like cysteine proteinase